MSKTITIRLNDDEKEMLEIYQKKLAKYFQGLEIDTSKAIKRAIYISANYDPLFQYQIEYDESFTTK